MLLIFLLLRSGFALQREVHNGTAHDAMLMAAMQDAMVGDASCKYTWYTQPKASAGT
jgi:hypothetical protein